MQPLPGPATHSDTTGRDPATSLASESATLCDPCSTASIREVCSCRSLALVPFPMKIARDLQMSARSPKRGDSSDDRNSSLAQFGVKRDFTAVQRNRSVHCWKLQDKILRRANQRDDRIRPAGQLLPRVCRIHPPSHRKCRRNRWSVVTQRSPRGYNPPGRLMLASERHITEGLRTTQLKVSCSGNSKFATPR